MGKPLVDIDRHPLVVHRRKFYSTRIGKLTRADSYVAPWMGSLVLFGVLATLSFPHFSVSALLILILSGLIWGSLYEYLNHRFLFHEFAYRKFLPGFQHIHLPHHIDVTDGINAGPLSYVPVFALFFILLSLLFGIHTTSAFMLGMITWFMWYEYQHDFDHLDESPKTKNQLLLFRYMRAHHSYHHDYPKLNYGVTVPIWDQVFKTFKKIQLP